MNEKPQYCGLALLQEQLCVDIPDEEQSWLIGQLTLADPGFMN